MHRFLPHLPATNAAWLAADAAQRSATVAPLAKFIPQDGFHVRLTFQVDGVHDDSI